MKVLLIGGGGREHALALGLKADPGVSELHCAPGNPGIAEVATLHPVDIASNESIMALAKELDVDFVVIGPELPLVNGVVDELREGSHERRWRSDCPKFYLHSAR
jgi:phosphoribosylamine--glycine ligase